MIKCDVGCGSGFGELDEIGDELTSDAIAILQPFIGRVVGHAPSTDRIRIQLISQRLGEGNYVREKAEIVDDELVNPRDVAEVDSCTEKDALVPLIGFTWGEARIDRPTRFAEETAGELGEDVLWRAVNGGAGHECAATESHFRGGVADHEFCLQASFSQHGRAPLRCDVVVAVGGVVTLDRGLSTVPWDLLAPGFQLHDLGVQLVPERVFIALDTEHSG
eukprot:GHVR01153721.1.p2 GENE.GHVR01153721.1~~GHVR01153721.1.p2  ORF type:complete len:220 (+),score=30.17 GHVR01153721.1:738-1397(+)